MARKVSLTFSWGCMFKMRVKASTPSHRSLESAAKRTYSEMVRPLLMESLHQKETGVRRDRFCHNELSR